MGYEFDNDEFHAYVHGRLPYDLLKPDPVLRNLLHSMPQQKIVCSNPNLMICNGNYRNTYRSRFMIDIVS